MNAIYSSQIVYSVSQIFQKLFSLNLQKIMKDMKKNTFAIVWAMKFFAAVYIIRSYVYFIFLSNRKFKTILNPTMYLFSFIRAIYDSLQHFL